MTDAAIRQPAVAGLFYPDDRTRLEQAVDEYLAAVPAPAGGAPKALIAPHAGYPYSGPVAGHAFAALGRGNTAISRIILIGPSHRCPVRGLAAPTATAFAMPSGPVPVEREAWAAVRDLSCVQTLDAAHDQEHGLEVELPFLQACVASFSIVPLVVGDAAPADVAEVLERLWGGPETLLVISSDLSHYYDYDTARRMDAATTEAIVALQPEAIGVEQACGRLAIQGLLLQAQRHGLRAEVCDCRNSGDTAGPRDRVVGYGAYVFR